MQDDEQISLNDVRPRPLVELSRELNQQEVERCFLGHGALVDVPCPCCGGLARQHAMDRLGLSYQSCLDCGALYMSPRPKPEAVTLLYRDGKAVQFWAEHYYAETATARRKKLFRPRALMLEALADTYGVTGDGVYLDIGAGDGLLLEEVEHLHRFRHLVGVEPAASLARVCKQKGFRILEKPMEEIASEELSCDVVSAFAVIEQLYEPLAFLAAVRRVIRPKGILVFTVQNAQGFDLQVLWDQSDSLTPPHHLNVFSITGAERLLSRAGFKPVEISTPGVLDVEIVRTALARSSAVHLSRFEKQIVKHEAIGRRFQAFLAANALSSFMQVVATPQ